MNTRYCIAITLLSPLLISSCGDSSFTTDWTDVGYSDGYAVGYNTTCEIRATLVEGNWDNQDYMEAYNDGYADGAADCRRSKQMI